MIRPPPIVPCPLPSLPVACCVLHVAQTEHAPRTTHHLTHPESRIPPCLTLNPQPSTLNHAFTLIEIMIVVAIMAIVMTMSVPIVYRVWHKAPLRQAVNDVVEVCSRARAQAILRGTMTEVVFRPREGNLGVRAAASPQPAGHDAIRAVEPAVPAPSGSGTSAQLSDRVIIETLDINMSGIEYNDAESARIRFYPNGTSDEMRMILFDGRDRIGIELEITTGLASVVPDPLREWTRR
jgi:prepilin-type N-terminal cleavage/methylation domain-containing protein